MIIAIIFRVIIILSNFMTGIFREWRKFQGIDKMSQDFIAK